MAAPAYSSGGFDPAGGLTVVGNNDGHVSPYLKAWIGQNDTCVCGVIGEGTSKEMTANWDSPFEEESVASAYRKIEGAIQVMTNRTFKTAEETTQVWSGNEPHSFNLVLNFYALADAKKEVEDALQALEKMASPDLLSMSPGGQKPGEVTLNIGRNVMLKNCIITSLSVPMDGPKTKDGYLARAEATLQLETRRMLQKSDVMASYR